MLHVKLPDDDQRLLVFYLAMEEYIPGILDRFPGIRGGREAFFVWQVPPTVIFGRNQVMEAEVNLAYCSANGVRLFRRKSGGGCVYADMGNIMVSYITDSTDVAFSFDRYMQRLSLVLRKAGLEAERSGRNDILVGGRKVSGNAFFHRSDASIVHGTLLFDSDFEAMTAAITPSRDKILSKGVNSVRQRVTNIREELAACASPLAARLSDIGKFKDFLIGSLRGNDREITLSEDDVRKIGEIEKSYLDPGFLRGRRHGWSVERETRIEGCGQVGISVGIDGDRFGELKLSGDYFTVREGLDELLSRRLAGKAVNAENVAAALEGIDPREYIMNLGAEDLAALILGGN